MKRFSILFLVVLASCAHRAPSSSTNPLPELHKGDIVAQVFDFAYTERDYNRGPNVLFSIVDQSPTDHQWLARSLFFGQLISGNPDFLSGTCMYRAPGEERVLTRSIDYYFPDSQSPLGNVFFDQAVLNNKISFQISQKDFETIKNCEQKTNEQRLAVGSRLFSKDKTHPFIVESAFSAKNDTDWPGYFFQQLLVLENQKTICLNPSGGITYVKPHFEAKWDSSHKEGKYEQSACKGYLIYGIRTQKGRAATHLKIISAHLGSDSTDFVQLFSQPAPHFDESVALLTARKVRNGELAETIDLDQLLTLKQPVAETVLSADNHQPSGTLHWLGDLNADQKLDYIYTRNFCFEANHCLEEKRGFFSKDPRELEDSTWQLDGRWMLHVY